VDKAVGDDFEFISSALALLRSKYRVVGLWSGAGAAAGVMIALLWPPKWTATASFLPVAQTSQRLPSGLSAVASQLGFSFEAPGEVSPRFYGDLIRGRVVLTSLLTRPLPNSIIGDSTVGQVTFGQWLAGDHSTPTEKSMFSAYRRLDKAISSRADNTTRLVSFSVTLPNRQVAVWTSAQLIEEANRFNRDVYRSTAKARREFLEERLTEAQKELHGVEDELASFYERNRLWQNAPQLAVQEARLRREIALRQDVFGTLSQQYEVARIDEVNETPLITVVDEPWAPPQRSSPRRTLIVLLAALGGFVCGWLLAMKRAYGPRSGYREISR
jgi:uncharacterized protein involved in exopolysaccharide biosynthesis